MEVLQRIRAYAPDQLFLIADGGRTSDEHAQCLKVRQTVEEAIDWPCRVERLYSEQNLGCRGNIPRGITWVFSLVDRSIILEDDTVPTPDFFAFCEEILERYADNHRVMTVSGTNYLPNHSFFGDYSYLFSGYSETCGYATWARAWHHYDADMQLWPVAKESGLLEASFLAPQEQACWHKRFDEVWSQTCKCDPYDFQWLFASWLNSGLSIVPRSSLVTNIGGGPEATHTQARSCKMLNRPVQPLVWPLKHPSIVVRNTLFDQQYGRFVFYGETPTPWQRLRSSLVSLLPEAVRPVLRRMK